MSINRQPGNISIFILIETKSENFSREKSKLPSFRRSRPKATNYLLITRIPRLLRLLMCHMTLHPPNFISNMHHHLHYIPKRLLNFAFAGATFSSGHISKKDGTNQRYVNIRFQQHRVVLAMVMTTATLADASAGVRFCTFFKDWARNPSK
jgi:hypothetical protein